MISRFFVVLLVLCFTSLVGFIGFYAVDEPVRRCVDDNITPGNIEYVLLCV